MRLAIPVPVRRVTAMDISIYGNEVYEHNFCRGGSDSVVTKLVEQIKPAFVDGKFDLWTMSPPCQPFSTTKGALRKDLEDLRCQGFLHLIHLIRTLTDPPFRIVLENVVGFFGSQAIGRWKEALASRGYTWIVFIINPMQLGVPNNRRRLYMICERSSRFEGYQNCVVSEIPQAPMRSLREFVEPMTETERARFVIADETLAKPWMAGLSIISKHDQLSFCFTSSYGSSMHKASGSLLHDSAADPVVRVPLQGKVSGDMTIYSGKIRFFSPKEVVNILGFPAGFEFPPLSCRKDKELKHMFHLAGQSVSIVAVRHVMRVLLLEGAELPPIPPNGGIAVVQNCQVLGGGADDDAGATPQ